MLVAKPNVVLNHFFDHMGDKRSLIREDVLNIVMYALLTFPSNEFDLKVCIFLIYNVLLACPSGPSIQTVSMKKPNTLNYPNSIRKILATYLTKKIY